MFSTASSTFPLAISSLPKAFTTLMPPNCSSTSVVIFASASLTLRETPIAFDEKFEASHKTAGIESKTKLPKGRLRTSKVILRIINKTMFAVAKGAIANASRT